jgi:hypothetical protein
MKKFKLFCVSAFLLVGWAADVMATPSTQIWIPSTDIQKFGTFHLGIDNYTTVFRDAEDGAHDFATDFGLTAGVLPFEKLQLEVGVDLFEPTDDPVMFNAKLGIPEEALFTYSPALAVGGFAFGTQTDEEKGATDYNIVYGLAAKTLPMVGRLSAGYYTGNDDLLVDIDGNKENHGLLLSWDRTMSEISDKLWMAVDYQGGKNAFGALGTGAAWSFSDNVSVILGYVFFNDNELVGKDTVTVQVDINF